MVQPVSPRLTRRASRRWLPLLAVAVACASLSCALATGETRRGPEPLRPVADRLAEGMSTLSFPWTAAPGSAGTIGEIVQTAGAEDEAPVTLRVLAGGTGVSLRSDCADGARAGGAWPDNTQVDVLEYGSARCAGWTRATSGNTTSWVRDEYLQGLPPPDQRTQPGLSSATPGDPAVAQLRAWTTALLDGAGRVALLSRHSPESKEALVTVTFLEKLQADMRALVAEIEAAGAAPRASCNAPRRPMIEAANTVGEMGKRMHTAFADGGDGGTAGLEPLADRYLASQQEAARLIAECARG